jgi:hypothetical protein
MFDVKCLPIFLPPTSDNLVSDCSGFPLPPTMSSASATGLGATNLVTLVDVIRHLTAIEEIMCPMQPMKDKMVTLKSMVAEQG